MACSTGVVTPLHRRQQIYAVCQKHDIVILEDDPYFYLQFSASSMAPRGLHNLGASYLSLDTDGRVIRLDSFSKVQLATFHHRLPVDRMQAQQKASLSCNHELSLAHRRSVVCWDGKCSAIHSTLNHVCFVSSFVAGLQSLVVRASLHSSTHHAALRQSASGHHASCMQHDHA